MLALFMSYLEKCLFGSLAHFWIGSFIFSVLSCMSRLYIFKLNSVSVALFAIISPILKAVFYLAYSFLHCAKAFKSN